jgi:hypothetical protein
MSRPNETLHLGGSRTEFEETPMTDDATKTTGPDMGSHADDSFAWTEPEPAQGDAAGKAREWLSQLQTMIENLATQAAPVVREVGAKAAELAAIAGDKAGPVAQRAAEFTGKAGEKIAEKSRDFAADLRRDAAASKPGTETMGDIAESASPEASTMVSSDTTTETSTWDEPTKSGVA